jgi:hypothetical protein
MTPPKPPPDDSANGSKAAPRRRQPPPLWRLAFDVIERPVGAASESWIQTDVFMDTLALTWKLQRRFAREMHRGLGLWLGLWDLPRRSDVTSLVTQIANLERQVRQVSRELERRERTDPPGPRQRPAATTRKVTSNGGKR